MLVVLSGCPNYFGEVLLTKTCIVGGLDNIIVEGYLEWILLIGQQS